MPPIPTYYMNEKTGRWCYANGTLVTKDEDKPTFIYKQIQQFYLQLVSVASDGTVTNYTGLSDLTAFKWVADNDWTLRYEGEVNEAISAGVPKTTLRWVEVDSVVPLREGGKIRLRNSSGDEETVTYTAWTYSSGGYIFDVSWTPTYSYADGDQADYLDSLLIESENSDIDSSNKATGKFLITASAYTAAYRDASEGKEIIANVKCEFQGYDSNSDKVWAKQTPIIAKGSLEDDSSTPPAGASNYYTKAEGDARYALTGVLMPKIVGGTPGNTVQIASDGATLEDAGATPGGGSGDVTGPASATPHALARFTDSSGKEIEGCLVEVDDLGTMTIPKVVTEEIEGPDSTNAVLVGGVQMTGGNAEVNDDPYSDSNWLNNNEVPTKNAIRNKIEALADEDVKEDLTVYAQKTQVSGNERMFLDDGGTPVAVRTNLFSLEGHDHGTDDEHSIYTPKSEITSENEGNDVIAYRSETDQVGTMPATLKFLSHFSGSAGDSSFVDRSPIANTITPIGSPVLAAGGKWGSAINLTGAEAISIPAEYLNFLAASFSIDGWKYIAAGNEGQTACLFSHPSMRVMLEDGDFVVYMKTDSAVNWNHEIRVAITVLADTWMHWGVMRNGATFYALFDGLVLDTYNIASKSLNAVNSGETAQFGVEEDSSAATQYFTGLFDELAIFVGGYNAEIVLSSDEQTYDKPTDEAYVTKRYILNPNGQSGNFYGTFTNADLDSNGKLTIDHNLNQTVPKVVIANNSSPRKEIVPDDVEFVNTNTCYIDLSSYAPITGTWIVAIMKGGSGSGSGGATSVAAEDVSVDQTAMVGPLSASGVVDAQTAFEVLDAKSVAVDAAVAAKLDKAASFREFTTNTDLANTDECKYLLGNSSGSLTLSIPAGLTSFTQAVSMQIGAGVVTLEAASGVTLNGTAGPATADFTAQFGAVTILQIAPDEYVAFGTLTPVVA